MAKRILLFGGTFDPVHVGHLIVARSVAERRGFDRVLLVPAASPPHKSPARATGAQRLEMLRLAIEGEDLFEICEVELRRAGPSYTIDTLQTVGEQWGGEVAIHLVIGMDMLADLPHWHRASEVVDAAEIVVACRPPWDSRIDEVFRSLSEHFSPEQCGRLRENVISAGLLDISSSEIRDRVGSGKSIRYLVPEPVSTYVESKGLYRLGLPSRAPNGQ